MTNSATKSAIVTGASGGIGGSVARRLAKDGFSVVVHYAGRPAPAQAVVADLKASGGQGIAVQGDVADAEDVERLFEESMEAFGRPDVWFTVRASCHYFRLPVETWPPSTR